MFSDHPTQPVTNHFYVHSDGKNDMGVHFSGLGPDRGRPHRILRQPTHRHDP